MKSKSNKRPAVPFVDDTKGHELRDVQITTINLPFGEKEKPRPGLPGTCCTCLP